MSGAGKVPCAFAWAGMAWEAISFDFCKSGVNVRQCLAGRDQDAGKTSNPPPIAMKTALLILLTITWFASWTGIALALSGGMVAFKPAPEPVVAVVER